MMIMKVIFIINSTFDICALVMHKMYSCCIWKERYAKILHPTENYKVRALAIKAVLQHPAALRIPSFFSRINSK